MPVLASIISKEDKINIEEANLVINKSIDTYLTFSLLKDLSKSNDSIKTKLYSIFKTKIIFSNHLITLVRYFQSVLKLKSREMTETSLLKSNSKYYKDFISIYKIIVR